MGFDFEQRPPVDINRLRSIMRGEVPLQQSNKSRVHFISEDFARDHLEIRAWRLIQNRSTEELRRIIATIEAAFPREEGGDK